MTDQTSSAEGTEAFAHLFPSMAVTKTPITETPPLAEKKGQVRLTNAGVDYVIVFRFPVSPPKTMTRSQLEMNVTEALTSTVNKVSRAGLLFQIRPGSQNGTLLVLVRCPSKRLRRECKTERVRDFLLGVRVDDIHEEAVASRSVDDFTDAERLRLVHDILTSAEKDGGADISPNVDKYVESIMPLHDDQFDHEWIQTWSRKWLIGKDDLTKIRDHFGEKIAFYFAFLQNYFLWLSVPSVLGVLVHLTHSNTLSISYSMAMLIWAVLFTEMWKRKQQELAISWGVRNCSKYERRRADFKGDKTVRDEVTGEEMPFCPAWKIFLRRALSVPGVAVGAVLLSVIVGFVFILQLFLHEYYDGPFRQILHYAPTIGYALLVPTMSTLYSNWVRVLNNWEMHKTETSWDRAYTQKIFIANFLVGYLSLFITGWIYIPFGDHVLPYLVDFNISHSHQKVDFQRLRSQLVYFVVTGQLIGFATEMLLPYVLARVMPEAKKITDKVTGTSEVAPVDIGVTSEIEAKFMKKIHREVALEEYNIYTDYVEMVIQFGYVSMFSTVWPLTSICCMLNNWVELRGDAVKICKYTRRPAPLRAEGVGPWIGSMETLVWLSSITMASFAYLFHPSTDIHSPYTPIFTLLAILLSEHFYVAVRLAVRSALGMLPSWSDLMVRKEDYKLKKVWLERLVRNKEEYDMKIEEFYSGDSLYGSLWSGTNNEVQLDGASRWVEASLKTN
ncbi:hypothetical protein DFQ28_000410 [Apophysomyces sp. BC1034]|nr:hypothetical protein DFQ30_006640 [Apophysomyces sp. BC1015]KAG0176816.1 hypothetical protein DFQ29_005590 [Apophysomyces sp. BC1021]KAG0183957.1 hypothetical protein DFQ28_000410 [Apophysomyces sp. BC1034]